MKANLLAQLFEDLETRKPKNLQVVYYGQNKDLEERHLKVHPLNGEPFYHGLSCAVTEIAIFQISVFLKNKGILSVSEFSDEVSGLYYKGQKFLNCTVKKVRKNQVLRDGDWIYCPIDIVLRINNDEKNQTI